MSDKKCPYCHKEIEILSVHVFHCEAIHGKEECVHDYRVAQFKDGSYQGVCNKCGHTWRNKK